jgi:hypothetical protein
MDEFPIARGSWLPVNAATELLSVQESTIRSRIADGFLEARIVDGVEFVRVTELRTAMLEEDP